MGGVVKKIGKIIKGVGKVIRGVVKAVVNVASSLINFVAQPFMGLLGGMPGVPDAASEATRQEGVKITQRGSNVNIPVVYGYRQVGGTITFAETGSTNNKYLWVAYALSEGPIEGLRELFIDDNKLPADIIPRLNAGETVDIASGEYKDRIKIQFSQGKYFTTPSSSTMGTNCIFNGEAPSWKTTMVYNGVAALFVRYEWKKIETQTDADNNPFTGNIPTIKANILGKKVASMLSADSPSSTEYDSASTRYSTNPAEVLVDYLRNPRYGKGLVNSELDFDSIQKAAAKCNQSVTYIDGITGPILTCNYVLDTAQSIMSNVKVLLMGFRAYLPYVQGKYKLKIEDAGNETDIQSGTATIVATFNEDNIQGTVTYTAVERTSKYNVVAVNFVNPDKEFSVDTVIFPEEQSERQTLIDTDGGRENKLEATFPTLTNYAIAKDFAKLLLNKSRFQETVSFVASSQALELEPGDNIYIQSKMLNFGSTPFRVVTMKINNDMTVDLGCVRNDDTLYPHTRHGEEDVVLPPYIPKGSTIIYPITKDGRPIGLVPPTHGERPIQHYPPQIFNISPVTVDSAGYTTITINGNNFQPGVTAQFIGNDGTVYTEDSATGSQVTRSSSQVITFETVTAMNQANSPYDVKVINSSTYGSLTARINNALAVEESVAQPTPDPDPPIQDPPVPQPDPPNPPPVDPPSPPPPEGPPPENPPAPVPPPVVTFDDFVTIDKVVFTIEGGLAYANITSVQPDRSDYQQLEVYYKRNISTETVFHQMTVTTKPGANQPLEYRLGPLLAGNIPYVVITRVKYVSGDLSTLVNKSFLNVSGGVIQEDPNDFQEQASTGWPSNPGTPVVRKDVPIKTIVGQTVLSGSNPSDPRQINYTITQDITNVPANFDVTSVNMYYKSIGADKFKVRNYQLNSFTTNDYVPGTAVTILTGDQSEYGNRSYPSIPNSAQQQYDLVFRFVFKDGSESTKQTRIMGVNTERQLGSYDYNPLFGKFIYNENVGDFTVVLEDPTAPSAAANMTITLNQILAQSNINGTFAQIYVQPPHSSVLADWRGLRIRYRKIIPGADPDFETITSTDTQINAISGLHPYLNQLELEFDKEYEIVITPLLRVSGVLTDSTQSIFLTGLIHDIQTREDYPSTGNWLMSLNPQAMTTAKALQQIDEAFPAPANPVVAVESFIQHTISENAPGEVGQAAKFAYYTLKFNHHAVANFQQLNIYRRTNEQVTIDPNGTQFGKGRFEKIQVTSLESSPTSTTVHLRPPLQNEYNAYYKIGGTQSLRRWFYEKTTHGLGTRTSDEFILVAQLTTGESAVGLRLQGTQGDIFSAPVDCIQGYRPTEVNVADFNKFNVALEKNLNQAIAAVAAADCKANTAYNSSPTWAAKQATKTPAIV